MDVEIEIKGDSFDSWVFRKKSHTGVLLNFNAVAPSKWKSGLIMCLLHRAKKICSSDMLFYNEVEKLKLMFYTNGYPLYIFNKALDKIIFIYNRNTINNESNVNNNSNLSIDNNLSENSENIKNWISTLRIPYIGSCFSKENYTFDQTKI